MKKLIRFIVYIIIFFIVAVLVYLFIGFISMDKNVGKIEYSDTLREAREENTLINEYLIYDERRNLIDTAWSEYGRTYNVFNVKKIEKNKQLLLINDRNIVTEKNNKLIKSEYKGKNLYPLYLKNNIIALTLNEEVDTLLLEYDTMKFNLIINR